MANAGPMQWKSWTRTTVLVMSLSTVLAGAAAVPATASAAGLTVAAAARWQLVGPNASGGHLAFTPAKPSRLYVLPDSGKSVYRTDDRGLSWRPQAGLGVPGGVGNRLAADPSDADVVYVAVTVLGSGTGSLVRSDDGAQTFRPVLNSSAGLADVVVAPSGREVFAAGDAGVFASYDSGWHWQQVPGAPAQVSRIALSGRDLIVSAAKGIYLIADALGTPQPAQQVLVTSAFPTLDLSVYGDVVLASSLNGAVLSTDRGRHWRPLSGPWGATDWLTFTGVSGLGDLEVQTIAGSADGTGAKNLWLSSDLGQTWSARPAATAKVDVYTDIGNFPDRPADQVVAASAGVYTTRDAVSFRRIGVPDTVVNALAVVGSALVAGTWSGTYRSSAPLRKDLPPGYQDWGPGGQAPPTIGNSIGAIAPIPKGRSALRVRNTYCGGGDCFVLERSRDGGVTWQQLTTGDGTSGTLAVDPANPSRIYAGSYLGVYVSDDGGKSLVLRHPAGLTGVKFLAVDPRAAGALWIGDHSGLYHSTDEGVSVSKVFGGEVDAVVVDPADPNHIVVGGNGMLKVSRDGGQTFTDAATPSGPEYDAIAFAPGGTVFAASRDYFVPGQGVIRSTDGGGHWTDVSTSLINRDVHALAVSPDGQWLFAGTGAGVYRLSLGLD